MNTTSTDNNDRLRQLVDGTGLLQLEALKVFNRGLGVRGLKESTWKGYFCKPSTTRWRNFNDALLTHAENVFGPLQKAGSQSS